MSPVRLVILFKIRINSVNLELLTVRKQLRRTSGRRLSFMWKKRSSEVFDCFKCLSVLPTISFMSRYWCSIKIKIFFLDFPTIDYSNHPTCPISCRPWLPPQRRSLKWRTNSTGRPSWPAASWSWTTRTTWTPSESWVSFIMLTSKYWSLHTEVYTLKSTEVFYCSM